MPKNAEKKPPFIFGITERNSPMRKALLAAVCAVFMTPNLLYAATNPAPTVTNTGYSTTLTCEEITGSHIIASEDTSLTPTVSVDESCKRVTAVYYQTKFIGTGSSNTPKKKTSCLECATGYVAEPHSGNTLGAVCHVTWYSCKKASTVTTPCEGLPCEGMIGSAYRSYSGTSTNHNLTRCNVSTNRCSYVCQHNYYARMSSIVGTPRSCSACPSVGNNNVKGYTTSYGANSITECYIRGNVDITDNTGTYQFTSNCYYTTE